MKPNLIGQKIKQFDDHMQDVESHVMEQTFTGQAGSGMVTVTLKGDHQIIPDSLKIDKALLNTDKKTLEDMIVLAINQANDDIRRYTKKKLMEVVKGFVDEVSSDSGSSPLDHV